MVPRVVQLVEQHSPFDGMVFAVYHDFRVAPFHVSFAYEVGSSWIGPMWKQLHGDAKAATRPPQSK
ncbi:MAG: hypothetical protein AMXMBFR84_14740 [Candidatus Hydrogenedentota bacterium]